MNKRNIPVVDLSHFVNGDASERAAFIQDLGTAFVEIGFVAVKNHGVDLQLIEDFFNASSEFFNKPEEIKKQYEMKGMAGQRGFTSFGREHAKQSEVADLKEFFQFGQEVASDHSNPEEYSKNPVTDCTPAFSEKGMQLYREFEDSGRHLLRAIAIFLNLDESYFDDKIKDGNSILRSIYYPPISQEPNSAIRAEEHEDINLITLLVGASKGGLQVLSKDNEWLPVMPEENELAINVGDMLQRLTNNYLKSTTHRVVNPPKARWHEPRISIPFFLHPISDMDLTCLDFCVTDERPLAFEPITAGDYLDERLREIGLKK